MFWVSHFLALEPVLVRLRQSSPPAAGPEKGSKGRWPLIIIHYKGVSNSGTSVLRWQATCLTGRQADLADGLGEAERLEVGPAAQSLQVGFEAVECEAVGEGRDGHDAVPGDDTWTVRCSVGETR